MKIKIYARAISFLALLGTACQDNSPISDDLPDGTLYSMKGVTVTSSHKQAQDFQLTATTAAGDTEQIKLSQIVIISQQDGSSYKLEAAQGDMSPKKQDGLLSGGVKVYWNNHHLQTNQAEFNRNNIVSREQVKIEGPLLNAVFDGASFNQADETITSLGNVNGVISPATF